ncbi:MAG: hypothetical protein H6737_17005 [Alphaproteobacteria bacterium]|nr:hypothetical protein [Alphaproteobacteria bacterium]
MIALLAVAWGGTFEPVVTELGGGARIDWTELVLLVEQGRARSGSEGTKAVEELARRDVDRAMGPAAAQIRISPDDTLAGLQDSPELWPSIEPRIGRWVETENRYHSSGKVTVIGALSLVELLKPVSMATATSRTGPATDLTGVVLDARGMEVAPCFAPEVRGPGGETVYDGRMWLESAVEHAPAVWVTDAADPAADRAGSNPVVSRVKSVDGCVLTVPERAATGLAELAESRLAGEGRLVVVVDP